MACANFLSLLAWPVAPLALFCVDRFCCVIHGRKLVLKALGDAEDIAFLSFSVIELRRSGI